MKNLYVNIISDCTSSESEGTQYGSWEEAYSNRLGDVSLNRINSFSCEKVPVDFPVKIGDIVYVLWAEWSTGNSFGHSDRGCTEVVHIFKDIDLAITAREILLEDENSADFDSWTVKFKSDTGIDISYYRSWFGYFESLDDLHLEVAVIKA